MECIVRVIDNEECEIVSGGRADFSDVSATVTSTEEIVSPADRYIKAWLWGHAYNLI